MKREPLTDEQLQEFKLQAIQHFTETLPAGVFRHWILKMFWGWFNSIDSIGIPIEDHDILGSVVRELVDLCDKLEKVE